MKAKLFINIRNVLDMGADFSGITVSDKAIEKALGGNCAMCEVLLTIINERIKWWMECDINKALYAKEIYDIFEYYYEEIIENE